MPKLYGTALYGKGNYSALTASNVTAAQGSYTETGEAALFPLSAKLTAAFGSYALTGFAAGINALSWSVAAGIYSLAGQLVLFASSNLWTGQTDVSTSWTPQPPTSDPWSPVIPGTTTWIPNP